jgi:hypothetical protein
VPYLFFILGKEELMKFRKKPVVIEATQWWKNGDHPKDRVGKETWDRDGEMYTIQEGQVVGFYKRAGGDEETEKQIHAECGNPWRAHGWVDTLEGGHIVCPGDWIITGVKGERYPCKPDIFEATYEEVEE